LSIPAYCWNGVSSRKLIMKIIVFAIACIFTSSAQAQQVISASGSDYSNGSAQISYTLGETVTFTGISSGNALTQGFQQPALKVTGIETISAPDIKVYPNPAFSILNIELATTGSYQLHDLNGKLVREGLLSDKSAIDMSEVAAATYVLTVAEGKNTNQYKIIKLK
jgi:Secretion system C-terminal sorting domain